MILEFIINHCPYCHEQMHPATANQLGNSSRLAVCVGCKHVMIIQRSVDDLRSVECAKMTRDAMDLFSPVQKLSAYELQEQIHFDAGHWG